MLWLCVVCCGVVEKLHNIALINIDGDQIVVVVCCGVLEKLHNIALINIGGDKIVVVVCCGCVFWG